MKIQVIVIEGVPHMKVDDHKADVQRYKDRIADLERRLGLDPLASFFDMLGLDKPLGSKR